MEKFAIGLWGCFFGMTALILAGAGLAFARSLQRISLNAGLTGFSSAFFVVAFLGGLPFSDADMLTRFLAHLAVAVSGMLAYQLLALLGALRSAKKQRRAMQILAAWCACIMAAGWWLSPPQSLALSTGTACLLGLVGLGMCLRGALQGMRLAWVAVFCVFCMLVALGGLSWIALNRQSALWHLHAMSAAAATLYLASLAYVLWARYAYLAELREVMAHGPAYDPVTRMRSHAETGQMAGEIFKHFRNQPEQPLGVMVLTIANLYALDKLHGAAAVNSALFVCAGRLRRSVPASVDMGRLGHDGFLLVMRNCRESGRLIHVARSVEARLRKSVSLGTNPDAARFESDNTVWVAEIGIGVMIVSNPAVRVSGAISMARGMSRTAMSYASRIAWLDHSSGAMIELPVLAPQ